MAIVPAVLGSRAWSAWCDWHLNYVRTYVRIRGVHTYAGYLVKAN